MLAFIGRSTSGFRPLAANYMDMGHHKDKRIAGTTHLHYRVEEIGSLKWTWRREPSVASPASTPSKKKKRA